VPPGHGHAPRGGGVAASAALYACALMVASTRQRDALSPAGVTIATLVYVSFAVVLIVRMGRMR
jgi:hypothetical protein